MGARDDHSAARDDLAAAPDDVMPDIAQTRELIPIAEELRDHDERVADIGARMWSAAAAGDLAAYNAAVDEVNVEVDAANDAMERLERGAS